MHSVDDFLGGQIKLEQGDYKATSDAVLLASAVPARSGQSVLDVGCGNGAVLLCLMARVAGLQGVGVDIQTEMLALAQKNAQLNGFEASFDLLDVAHQPASWKERQFHHVFTNPPYFTETPARANAVTAKAHQQALDLKVWLNFCIKKVRAKGTLTIIHRTEAVPEILSILNGRMGKIVLVPFYPKSGVRPKRVLIQASMNSKAPFELHTGFVLHNDDDTRSEWAEDVMRFGKSLF